MRPARCACGGILRVALARVPSVLEALDARLSISGGRPTLDIDEVVSAAAAALRVYIHGWAQVWDETTPCAEGSRPARARSLTHAPSAALYMASQELDGHEWVCDATSEILGALCAAERVVSTRVPLGG